MKSEFYSSLRCIDFVKEIIKDTALHLLTDIKQEINSGDSSKTLELISIMESDLRNQEKLEQKFRYIEEIYGYIHYETKSIPRAAYIIDIYDIINAYIGNEEIKTMFSNDYTSKIDNTMCSFFDGNFFRQRPTTSKKVIYISLYADEINLANAIGIFY